MKPNSQRDFYIKIIMVIVIGALAALGDLMANKGAAAFTLPPPLALALFGLITVILIIIAVVRETYKISTGQTSITAGASHQSRRRLKKVFVPIVIVFFVLLISGSALYVVANKANKSIAYVMLLPSSKFVKGTFTISAVRGVSNISKNQVGARLLSSITIPQAQTAQATGRRMTSSTSAMGTISIINWGTSQQTFTEGRVIGPNQNPSGPPISMVLAATVTIQPGLSTIIPAWVYQAGAIGNFPAFNYNTRSDPFYYCSGSGCNSQLGSGIYANNTSAFTGGQNLQNYTFIQQSDIDNAASTLESADTPNPEHELQAMIHSNESYINAPSCKPKVTSNHGAGEQASSVIVTISFICTGEVYNKVAVRTMAEKLLSDQAATTFGSEYALVGNIMTVISQAKLVDAKQGTIVLTDEASGMWVYRFSNDQKQQLAHLVAGLKMQKARGLLDQQAGVKQANVQVSGGDGDTLPTDVSRINVVVQSVTITQTPTKG